MEITNLEHLLSHINAHHESKMIKPLFTKTVLSLRWIVFWFVVSYVNSLFAAGADTSTNQITEVIEQPSSEISITFVTTFTGGSAILGIAFASVIYFALPKSDVRLVKGFWFLDVSSG